MKLPKDWALGRTNIGGVLWKIRGVEGRP
jgi:hypothetical protein